MANVTPERAADYRESSRIVAMTLAGMGWAILERQDDELTDRFLRVLTALGDLFALEAEIMGWLRDDPGLSHRP